MGSPAIVMNDLIQGVCGIHLIPNPASGAPQPGPPVPFSAPITVGVVPTVMIGGKPAAVMGCSGFNTPPHVGLHPTDPFFGPPLQVGRILTGSATVMFGGQPAATQSSQALCCATPGQLVPTVTNVMIG